MDAEENIGSALTLRSSVQVSEEEQTSQEQKPAIDVPLHARVNRYLQDCLLNITDSCVFMGTFSTDYDYKTTKWLKASFASIAVILAALVSSVCAVVNLMIEKGNTGNEFCRSSKEDDSGGSLPTEQYVKLKADCCNPDDSYDDEHDFPCNKKGFNEDIFESKSHHFPYSLYTRFTHFRPFISTYAMFPARTGNTLQSQNAQGSKDPNKDPPPQPPNEGRKWPLDSVYGLPWSTFRQELSRLGTFMDMPANSPVFAVRLAQAGFLRYPDGAIICYFCGLQRDEWNAGDNPVEIHRRLRGDCPLVTGEACENQPAVITFPEERLQELMAVWSLSGPSLVQGREPAHQQRGVEVADATATASQPTQTTSRAAQPSAYSTGRDPTARAADLAADGHPPASGAGSAGAQASAPPDRQATPAAAAANPGISGASPLSAPAVGNNSAQARDQLPPRMGLMGGDVASANPGAPRGPIFDGTAQPEPPRNPADNISASGSEPRAGQQVVTYQQLGIVTESPKRSDMAMINSRVGSFRNWPATASHTPLQLAEAGFYYAGYADCGRCFFCGGGLKNWEPVDNAWVEHARWFAKCAYIRQCQGQDFIDVVQELNVDRCPISLDQVTAEINRRRADGERIQEPVVDPAVSSILELGVRQEDINSAVLRVQREGHLVTADRLLDTLQAEGVLAAGGGDDASSILDSELGQVEELVTENSAIREQRMCKICLDKESCIVFLPCGHLVSCAECSPALKHCPMCRQRVKGRVRAFPA